MSMQCIQRKHCIKGRNAVSGHMNNWYSGVIFDEYKYYQYQNSCRLWDYVSEIFANVLGERSSVYLVKAIHRREKYSHWIHVHNWNSGVSFDEYKHCQYQNSCILQDFGTMSQK